MPESFGITISNLIRSQFPEIYRETGPLLVQFVSEYYHWLETRTPAREDWFVDKVSLVNVQNKSANVVGRGTFFTTQFEVGDSIAISKGESTNDYEMFTVKSIANDVFLTLTDNKLPNFSHANTRYATVSDKPNALFLSRNFPELHDVDETFDEYIVYFKEKYLKNIQFQTITNTRKLIKHSLDLYRSKGTERSIDLLYKIAFGKPASVYYPGQDIFRLSSGIWYIPRYLELSLCEANKTLVNREIVGVISGAVAFVEALIRKVSNNKIVEIAYMSAIDGNFITGEKVILSDGSLEMDHAPTIVGSLNDIWFADAGSGDSFEINETVNVSSLNGRGALAKVLTTSNTTGFLTYDLVDGGYGYTTNTQLFTTTGNVSVETGNSIITGTGTLFETEYSVGDYISVYSDTDVYETHQVESITNNTILEVTNNFTFSNTDTPAAFTRYFAQTFISEKILTISNATFNSEYTNFEYIPFLEGITQPAALMNYESANGNFTTGEHIFTYHANNDQKGEGHILSITKKTSTSGILTVSVLSGDLDETNFYTEANAIGASLTVANGYIDATVTANVIGNYSNVTVVVNTSVTFTDNEIVVQPITGAWGTVSGSIIVPGTGCIVSIKNSEGIFKNGFSITGVTSGASGLVTQTEISVGVINVSNSYFTLPESYIYTDQMQGHLTGVSLGQGADVTFANSILYPEEITYATDYIYPYLALELGAVSWPFPADPTANLSSTIGDTMSYNTLTIGKAEAIIASSPGIEYNKTPIVRLHEPTIFNLHVSDAVTLVVTSTDGFSVGEVVTQEATNARGMIQSISNTEMSIQNMRFYTNNSFVATSNSTTIIVGAESGFVANVVSITSRPMSSRYGSDVTMDMDLTVSEGSITSIQILDSGFGFANGEVVTIESGDKTANGLAILQTHGTGSGYYKSTDGFLSDVKKLSDGYYWQEYSYEVRSSVIDDFKKKLKNVVHVAGTKYFDALIFDSVNVTEPTVETTVTIS